MASENPSRFLAQLPKAFCKRFVAACTPVELKLSEVITRPGQRLTNVYFPTGAYISQVMVIDRREVEVGLVGDEGMYGIQAGMGTGISAVRAIVQGAGPALRMPLASFRARLGRSAELRELLTRYTFFVYSQAVHSAACNRFHLMEQRLARWLLHTADRARTSTFATTHQLVAAMLGVRRAGVTETVSELKSLELVEYTRGRIRILDRAGLEKLACACYRADREMYERALEGTASGVIGGSANSHCAGAPGAAHWPQFPSGRKPQIRRSSPAC